MRGLVAVAGRILLWSAVGLVFFVGLGRIGVVVFGGSRTAGDATARAFVRAPTWPDNGARNLAIAFARDYWTLDPEHADRYTEALEAHASADVSSRVTPTWPAGTRLRADTVAIADEHALPDEDRGQRQRALITVSARVAEGNHTPRTMYLTVPIARNPGGLTVYDLPAFSAGPPRAEDAGDNVGNLDTAEQVEIHGRLERFFTAYLSGDTTALQDFTKPGVHLNALTVPMQLRDVGSINLTTEPRGRIREVVVDVTAIKSTDKSTDDEATVFPLRYHLRLEYGDLWYVASINQGGS